MKKKQPPSHSVQVCQPAGQDCRADEREFCPVRIEVRVHSQFERILASVSNPNLTDLGNVEPQYSVSAERLNADASHAPAFCNYGQLEKWLFVELYTLARLLIGLFIATVRTQSGEFPNKTPGRARRRQLKGIFGTVSYWREGKSGHFPLDNLLGITKGKFSHSVCMLACNLATRMSFAVAARVFERFTGWCPDPVSIENRVLAIGPQASSYMEQSAPQKDPTKRQVLVIEIDGKAPPTATEQELKKRSASAKAKSTAGRNKSTQSNASTPRRCCPRHRSKAIRQRMRKKKQAAKAKRAKTEEQKKDPQESKAKNGRSATLVVTYVLEEGADGQLHGPKDKRVWADFGPRINMIDWAKAEAQRRGFDPQNRDIHLVMDGEKCLRDGLREHFPNATIALDIRHAQEYLHDLGKLLYKSKKAYESREAFVEKYRVMLYEGQAAEMVEELQGIVDDANQAKRQAGGDPDDGEYEEIEKKIAYFARRLEMLDYAKLQKEDLVIASGQVEGAARHLIGERMDCGGMRWKVDRARLLLHLRCIEINGEWESFSGWLSKKNHEQLAHGKVVRLTARTPPPMPTSSRETAQVA